MALKVAKRLLSHNFLDFITLDNDIEITQVRVNDFLVGKSVLEANVRRHFGLNIIAIEHHHRTDIEISPDYRFCEDDIVVVIGKKENIKRFEETCS